MKKLTILGLSVALVAMFLVRWPAGILPAHSSVQLAPVYEVTTRGDFNSIGVLCCASADAYRIQAGGALISGGAVSPLDDLYNTGCPAEAAVIVHGWDNTEDSALEKFDRARLSLSANNYAAPIIGYSWDSDQGLGEPVDKWYTANSIATDNGPKLAHFLTDFKTQCPSTLVRIVAHSLGARVVVDAINQLETKTEWK